LGWVAFTGRDLDGGWGAFAGKGLGGGGMGAFVGRGLDGGWGAGISSSSSQSLQLQSKWTTWLMAGLGSVAVVASSFFMCRLPTMCTL
jgi:hypothetical protein